MRNVQVAEVTLEDVVSMCELAAQGDLEPRLRNNQPDPQMRRLVVSINHLLDMVDSYVRESEAVLHQLQLRQQDQTPPKYVQLYLIV